MAKLLTAEEWDAAVDLSALVRCYRERVWWPRLRLFAVACCRRIWDLVPPGPGGRDAVEIAARYAQGQAGDLELRRAAADGAALVESIRRRAAEGLYGGLAIRVFGAVDEYPALAAWGCTFSGRHPAQVVPGAVREVVHLRQYQAANHGQSRTEVWSNRAEAAGRQAAEEELAWQVAELRATLGNPFRSREAASGNLSRIPPPPDIKQNTPPVDL